jgi:FdhD protein
VRNDTPPLVRDYSVKRVKNGHVTRTADLVAAEEPLQIRIRHQFKSRQISTDLSLTMRTPGHDLELAAGFLFSEGIIRSREDIVNIHSLGPEPSDEMLAELSEQVDIEAWKLGRATVLNASCGVCGRRSVEALANMLPPQTNGTFTMRASAIANLPQSLEQLQKGFSQTGGLHAAALANSDGEVQSVFEDIGRHNALDKLIGSALLQGCVPLSNSILFLTSRSSFELVQKAAMAGAPVIATVGAPSSLAVDTARECGLTLVGFVRQGRFNVYSGDWRILVEDEAAVQGQQSSAPFEQT